MKEIKLLLKKCRELPLREAKLSPEYYYNSLSICVIDSVFSISMRYTTTKNVVDNFCKAAGIQRFREYGSDYTCKNFQYSIKDLISLYDEQPISKLTDHYYRNRNRTSTCNGILKSIAVYDFAKVLSDWEIDYFQDMDRVVRNVDFESSIKSIRGQSSGLSLDYFYMLSGRDDFIKPDRMIGRFIEAAIGKKVSNEEAIELLKEVYLILSVDFPFLTLRLLDHTIWNHQKRIRYG